MALSFITPIRSGDQRFAVSIHKSGQIHFMKGAAVQLKLDEIQYVAFAQNSAVKDNALYMVFSKEKKTNFIKISNTKGHYSVSANSILKSLKFEGNAKGHAIFDIIKDTVDKLDCYKIQIPVPSAKKSEK
jgi:hypothetical protein